MKTAVTNIGVNCETFTNDVLSVMKADGYACKNEFYIYRMLTAFCKERHEGNYCPDIGAIFLSEKIGAIQSIGHRHVYQNAISRLDQALLGNFHWKPEPVLKPYPHSCFDVVVDEYEEYLSRTKKKRCDIRSHARLAAFFLSAAEEQGVCRMEDITPSIVFNAFEKARNKEGFRKIKPFFRYAFHYGLISRDLNEAVPTVSRHKPIPTVYTLEEINAVLGAVDRSTGIGKRDYCILLFAARYGMRTSDIANLVFENIDRSRGIIHIVQEKTGVPVNFPLTKEVLEALNDYINHVRPDSEMHNVFWGVPRPYARPLSIQGIYGIVSKYFAKSGIDIRGKRHGAHALRSSLATQILNDGAGYPEVQVILGHTSPDAATHYIKVESEKLRRCAMDVPLPEQGLRAYLEGGV